MEAHTIAIAFNILFAILLIFAIVLWTGLSLVLYGRNSERGKKFKEKHPKLYKLLEK